MTNFDIHTTATAPEDSVALLEGAKSAFGFVPNLLGVFAEAPAALKSYLTIGKIFDETSFSPTERQVIILAVSRINECHYCIAAHSVVAGMQSVPADVIDALRNDTEITDKKLEALRTFATAVVEKQGWVGDDEIAAFIAAGYSKAQILEVIVGIAFKTLSNFANHIADTPVDDAFAAQTWQPATTAVAS